MAWQEKSGRGLPSSIPQEEILNQSLQGTIGVTVEAATLVGDPRCPNLVTVSVYNTKPFHFLSMRCEQVKWVEK